MKYRDIKYYKEIVEKKREMCVTGKFDNKEAMNAIIRFIESFYPNGKNCNMDIVLGKLFDAFYDNSNFLMFNHEYGTVTEQDSVTILVINHLSGEIVTRVTFTYIDNETSVDCVVVDSKLLDGDKVLTNNYYFNNNDTIIHSFYRKPEDDEYSKSYLRTIAYDDDCNEYREIVEGPTFIKTFENEEDIESFIKSSKVPEDVIINLYPEIFYDHRDRVATTRKHTN